ncbi:gluconokinase [Amycolatopsis keratiniphila]|uniref:Gluconokinase n=1 Tax=Amycolatopsis keratiniphila subsp. keratiniphila TaxID=227715 RepID=A0A1W2LIG0_9PSEU|nr:gluconokinase [Amycolatopsis keratiniphila]OLZ56817.1 gluconokinase [Amycolatopsis keratiniphila subsp. nogabecina]ONF62613.1 gluconokinase [Amycolatopsis keratiniphila subsp. keratiniphila]SDU47678.1 gluconokinase [Amycolatopsis keratiniphila]
MTVIVVMGVSGSGKTTVGTALAERLGVDYAEADTFHPKANIDKMSSGHPLNDEDRQPWLEAIATWIRDHQCSGGVVTSSALKYRYRDILRSGGKVWFLHLHGDRDLLADRMKTRSGHFMPVSLLDSQLADLEPLQPDEHGLVADIAKKPAEIVETALSVFKDR